MVVRSPGGVAGFSPASVFALSDLILAEVGVLKGSKFKGGNLSVCRAFLLALDCGLGFCSASIGSGGPETYDEVLGARAVSSAFMASVNVETTGLADIAPSKGGRLEDLAEKKG